MSEGLRMTKTLCEEFNCNQLMDGVCNHYSVAYMEWVTRYGHCPFSKLGPRQVKKADQKIRLGQAKTKGKKK